jgi:hypothetical protein
MMAVNVLDNGVNIELIKKIFQSFVKLAVKKKKRDKIANSKNIFASFK